MARHKYTGILAKREPAPWGDVSVSEDGTTPTLRWYMERISALMIDCDAAELKLEDQWRQVALVLMERHVPAFQATFSSFVVGTRRGRPPKTSGRENQFIWQEMRRLIQAGKSERSAAELVAKKRRKGEKAPPSLLGTGG